MIACHIEEEVDHTTSQRSDFAGSAMWTLIFTLFHGAGTVCTLQAQGEGKAGASQYLQQT